MALLVVSKRLKYLEENWIYSDKAEIPIYNNAMQIDLFPLSGNRIKKIIENRTKIMHSK